MSGSRYTRSFNDILVSQIWSFWSGDKHLRPAILLLQWPHHDYHTSLAVQGTVIALRLLAQGVWFLNLR
jgi:hypothetical protein